MNRRGFAPIIILLILVGVLATGAGVYFYSHQKTPTITTNPMEQGSPGVIPTESAVQQSTSSERLIIEQSSTKFVSTKIGSFILNTYCNNKNRIDRIDVIDGTSTLQTISRPGIESVPGGSCPIPEAKNINFDAYPDMMLFSNAGATGNVIYELWIYDTSTKQFSNFGDISNPSFDSNAKLVTSYANMGCAGTCYTALIYKSINGKLILYEEDDVNWLEGASEYIKTVKQLEGGQLIVISTSTVLNPIPTEDTKALCSDGIDNDMDGAKDLADDDCKAFRNSQ